MQTAMVISPTFGTFLFDAVFTTNHSSNVTVTSHPVQSGASVADHAIVEPDEVSIEIGMTDAAFSASGAHSVNAYTTLKAIMQLREPVTLVTRYEVYRDMIITSLSAPDDYKTMYALRANIYFRKIRIVSVAALTIREQVTSSVAESTQGSEGTSGQTGYVGASSDPDDTPPSATTSPSVSSTKPPTQPSQSVLSQLAQYFSNKRR